MTMAVATTLSSLLNPAPNPLGIAPTFLVLGIAFHQCIRTTEIDNRIKSLLALYSVVWLVLCASYIYIYSVGVLYAIGSALFAACSFNIGLTISILVYRAFFHRLGHFPGPWDAKLSRLALVKRAINRTQYHLDLQEMHQKYGDFVRTGPREISINRPSAVMAINGPQSSCLKAPWYSHVSDDVTQISLNSTRDPQVHRRRRKAWDRGMKALPSYEPRVQHKVNALATQIRSRLNKPLDISQWTMYLAFDVMGLVGFSEDFRQLEDGTEQAAIKELHQQMLFLGILKSAPWILTILGFIQGLVGEYGQFMTYCADRVGEKKEQWKAKMADKGDDNTPKDVISWLVKALYEEDQSAPPGHQALNEDGRLMIIAGSDTTGTTLAHAIYYLTKNPHALQALQKELDTLSTTEPFTNDKLQSLPYLDAVIKETLRLKPAVPSGQPRLTPSTGLQIDEVWIPGNTIVVIPPYVLQRDERCFPSGEEFIPERWIDSEKRNLVKHDEAFFPFQVGRYACVGKQLALMQLRAVIARVAVEFDMGFAEGEDGVGFDRGSMDTFTFTLGELGVVFRERERGGRGGIKGLWT